MGVHEEDSVRAGLLPDPLSDRNSPALTVTFNDSRKYEDRWVYLKVSSTKSEFLKEEEVIELPVAHGEGKFLTRDDQVLQTLRDNGQLVIRYVGPGGKPAGYPWNPKIGQTGSPMAPAAPDK